MDFEKVKEIIVETLSCDADKVTMEATLAEDLEADSLSAVELSMALEEAYRHRHCRRGPAQHEDRGRPVQLPAGARRRG